MGLIRSDAQTQRREVRRETMLTATRNEQVDNYGPTDSPQLTGKISTECYYVGAVDQRISRRDRVKPVGMARGKRGNLQRYEGASTIYGPLSLPAYVSQFKKLAAALIQNTPLPPGPKPSNFGEKVPSFLPGVLFDNPHFGTQFGDVLVQPQEIYTDVSFAVVSFLSLFHYFTYMSQTDQMCQFSIMLKQALPENFT
ncbi:unnamed protein product [Echinostoma caproni]|uniref:Ceramidse_alk_C domain-containing protein n=1 Tax=Echinostoma caproni TaxID=27848 RepID=A0A183ARQ5_9TREM|nr:unnamed protein product [Echinostoma caproni]